VQKTPRETLNQYVTGACRPVAQGDYTHRQNQAANKNYQVWAIKGNTNAVF
jgi:hypothetical protein